MQYHEYAKGDNGDLVPPFAASSDDLTLVDDGPLEEIDMDKLKAEATEVSINGQMDGN